MSTFIENTLGLVYNVCFISCYWPQIVKSIRTRSVEDVSISLYLLSIIGYASAASYAYMRFGLDLWLLLNYALSGFSAIFMVVVFFKFKKINVW